MGRVLLASRDSHFALQLKSWLGEFPGELQLEVASDLESWVKTYLEPVDPSAEKAELPVIIIVDHSPGAAHPGRRISAVRELLSSDDKKAPPFFLMAPELVTTHPDEIAKSGVDDLITKPVDKPIFLQKMELLLARDAAVSPTFLFKVKTALNIEVGKDCVIDELSEVEIFIRNPVAIRLMTRATLHCDIFGAGPDAKVDVVVIGSQMLNETNHPWRLHLRFFGLKAKQLSRIRHTIQEMKLVEREKTRAVARGFKAKMSAAKSEARPVISHRPLRLAIIDVDPNTQRLFSHALESVTTTVLTSFPTPSRLLAALHALKSPPPAPEPPPTPEPTPVVEAPPVVAETTPAPTASTEDEVGLLDLVAEEPPVEKEPEVKLPAFPSEEGASFLIRGDDFSVTKMEQPLDPHASVLGWEQSHWMDDPLLLLSSVDEHDRTVFEELIQFAVNSGRAQGRVRVKDRKDEALQIDLELERVKSRQGEHAAIISLRMKEATSGEETALHASDLQFEAVVVEAAFLRDDPSARIATIRGAFVAAGVCASVEEAPAIFVIAEESSGTDSHALLIDGISHFAWKIADRRHILETFLVFAPSTVWNQEGLEPVRCTTHITAHITRAAKVIELSEVSLTIEDSLKFRPGSVLRVFSDVLTESPHGIVAKCRRSAENGKVSLSEFTFFESSEEFQKRIRTFVRAEFARKKALDEAS